MKFKALMNGTVNAVSINQRLRALWEAFAQLKSDIAQLQALAGVVPKTNETVPVEAVVETIEEVPAESAFDWQKSEDVTALKAFALKELNLTITGNKGAARIRSDIADFLTLNMEK